MMRAVLAVTSLSLADKAKPQQASWDQEGREEALIKMKGKKSGNSCTDMIPASNDQEICRIPNSISSPRALSLGVPGALLSELMIFLI